MGVLELRNARVSPRPQGGSERDRDDLWFAAEGGLLLGSQRCYPGMLGLMPQRGMESETGDPGSDVSSL